MSGQREFLRLCTRVARETRIEVADYFGFREPQSSQLVGLCGEVALRVRRKLCSEGHPSSIAHLRLQDRVDHCCAHKVTISGGLIIDASVSQFVIPDYRSFLMGPEVPDGFCFSARTLLNSFPELECHHGDPYPVGPVVAANWHTPDPKTLYASRSYILFSYPTRFASDLADLKGLRPFERALQTGDIEWRRTCASALEMFHGSGDASVIAFAKRLLRDSDRLVKEIASVHYDKLKEV